MILKQLLFCAGFCWLSCLTVWAGPRSAKLGRNPEPADWFAGDAHVHMDCGVGSGHEPVTPEDILTMMQTHNLAVVSMLADMGNGEARRAELDLPKVNGGDYPASKPGRLLHWDAEWHFDPQGVTFEKKVIGGHLINLGLQHAETTFAEYTYPIIQWVKKQGGIAGYAHMQYLNDELPNKLSCCQPLEYPVEVALGTVDFLMEDVWRNEAVIHAYYRLLNCGFRPGLAAATDFPCNDRKPIGSLLTYVSVPGGKLTYRSWIEGIAKGRTVISTNGHEEFLDLKVDGHARPGDEIRLPREKRLPVTVRWTSLQPLKGRIELVQNGNVVGSQEGSALSGSPVEMRTSLDFKESGWVCARRMNEQGHQTHTAAVFIKVKEAPVRASAEDALYFVRFIDNLLEKTSPGGPWNQYFPKDLAAAQSRYRQAREIYQKIADEAHVHEGK